MHLAISWYGLTIAIAIKVLHDILHNNKLSLYMTLYHACMHNNYRVQVAHTVFYSSELVCE